MEGATKWLSSQAAHFLDTGTQVVFPHTSVSIPAGTTVRSCLSMYFLYILFFLVACFVNSSPGVTFRITLVFITSNTRDLCPAHTILLAISTLTKLDEWYIPWSPPLCNFPHSRITSHFPHSNSSSSSSRCIQPGLLHYPVKSIICKSERAQMIRMNDHPCSNNPRNTDILNPIFPSDITTMCNSSSSLLHSCFRTLLSEMRDTCRLSNPGSIAVLTPVIVGSSLHPSLHRLEYWTQCLNAQSYLLEN
jgi:hypothetical protein